MRYDFSRRIHHITRTPKTRQARFREPRGGPPSPLEKAYVVYRFANIQSWSETNKKPSLVREGGNGEILSKPLTDE